MDLTPYLELIKDPRTGLQLAATLVVLNVMFGTILAVRARAFSRAFLLNFLQTRILEQLLPVALLGLGAMQLDMPILLALYGIGATFMLFDVGGDVMAKVAQLWPRKE